MAVQSRSPYIEGGIASGVRLAGKLRSRLESFEGEGQVDDEKHREYDACMRRQPETIEGKRSEFANGTS